MLFGYASKCGIFLTSRLSPAAVETLASVPQARTCRAWPWEVTDLPHLCTYIETACADFYPYPSIPSIPPSIHPSMYLCIYLLLVSSQRGREGSYHVGQRRSSRAAVFPMFMLLERDGPCLAQYLYMETCGRR